MSNVYDDTTGMRSQKHEGRHGPRKHESRFMFHGAFVACLMSCFMSCFMLQIHASCFISCFMCCFMSCSLVHVDAMLRVMLGVMLHASYHKSSTLRFMPLLMLYVLLLGMLHAACHVSPHEALCFIFHASCGRHGPRKHESPCVMRDLSHA